MLTVPSIGDRDHVGRRRGTLGWALLAVVLIPGLDLLSVAITFLVVRLSAALRAYDVLEELP
jgi:hypothetical protein